MKRPLFWSIPLNFTLDAVKMLVNQLVRIEVQNSKHSSWLTVDRLAHFTHSSSVSFFLLYREYIVWPMLLSLNFK